jgi:hypothetical protein
LLGAAGAGDAGWVVVVAPVVDVSGELTGCGQNDQATATITMTAMIPPHIFHLDGSCAGTELRSGRLKSFVMAIPPIKEKTLSCMRSSRQPEH